MKKKLVVKKIQHSRKLLKALDNLTVETKNLEEQFADELHLFFQYLGRKVISEVDLSKPLESVFYGYAKDVINKYWVEYEKILSHYVDEAAIIGNVHYDILLEASKDKAKHFKATKSKNNKRQFLDNELNVSENKELFAPNPKVSSRLKRYKFEASDKTMARVDNEINQILSEAYREGWGPRDVGQKIQQRFTDLSTYESRRIAQTEINTTRNYVQYQRMQDDEMEYKIWHAAHDSRTRKSHLDVDEEIVPINERFSNGLMYPGDKEGPISEWVNCRCSHAAYIMPLGYQAPDFFPFKESDLVKVGSSLSQDYVSEIQERIRLIDGAMVRQEQENKVDKPPVVEPIAKPKPKKPKKPKVEKPKPMLEGEYKTYTEIDPTSKAKVTVYQYENGFEIAVNENALLSHEELVSHLKTLPIELQSIGSLKRITIKDWHHRQKGGHFAPTPQEVVVFKSAGSKSRHFEVLNHELGHAYDNMKGVGSNKHGLSKTEIYEKIFKADNEHQHKIRGGKGRVTNIFVTDYAARSYVKYKKRYRKGLRIWEKGSKNPELKPEDFRFGEDFAESVALYHHPLKHDQFIKDFPNRSKYLESIFGKPKFKKNNLYYKELLKEEKEKQAYLKKQKENEIAQEKLDKLTEKQLDKELEKVLGSKAKVKAYHRMKEELHKLDMVPIAISAQEIEVLTQNGWDRAIAKDIMKNPNDYLPTVNAKRRKYKNIIEETLALVKQQL